MPLHKYNIPLLSLLSMVFSMQAYATPNCSTAPQGSPCYFTNVSAFAGQSFDHISFDSADEQTPSAIVQKYNNIASFQITGGEGAIRHTSQHYSNFPGEGTEGGAVSGEYRIDLGYTGNSTVTVSFVTPVFAVGGFFGGVVGASSVTVQLQNGSQHVISRFDAGLPAVPNSETSPNGECQAINGFLGISSHNGVGITSVTFSVSQDASSLDSLFFGAANTSGQGPGVTRFPETWVNSNCVALGFPSPPILPVSVPPVIDTDGDGMPDDWENQYGLNPFDPNDALVDSDGDGLSNLTEFDNGTDPTYYNGDPIADSMNNLEVDGVLRLVPQSTPPVTCGIDTEGSMYYDSFLKLAFICDGMDWSAYQGRQGDQGPEGPMGPMGPMGMTGPQGPAGPQGETGPVGPQGEQGPKGDKGDKGDSGEKGEKGDPGKDAAFADLQCSTNQIIRYNGNSWECAPDVLNQLAMSCRDGDTIMFENGAIKCAKLPSGGSAAGGRKDDRDDFRNKVKDWWDERKSYFNDRRK